jgi:hypothetical protein
MSRVVVHAAILVGLLPGVAFGKGQKVHIETVPKNASVYLNDKESGVSCTTPCDPELGPGETTVIIELAGYESVFEVVEVKAGKKPPPLSMKLVRAVGTIIVEGAGAANGAKIEIDGSDTGKVAPAKLEYEAGPHLVIVTSRTGQELFNGSVEVTTNLDSKVQPRQSVATADVVKREPDPTPEQPPAIRETTPTPRGSIISASVVADVGFRDFKYTNLRGPPMSMAPTQRSEFDEGGQVLLGPQVEIYPGVLLGIPALRGLFIFGRFQYGVNPQNVSGLNLAGKTTTFWQSFEASIHHRWTILDTATLQVGGGYTRDQFEFNGEEQDINIEPDVDYSAFKVAVRSSLLLGGFEPYVIGELRDVFDGGRVGTRFSRSSIQGYRAAAGITAKTGSLSARAEGSVMLYSWGFVNNGDAGKDQADSATDVIMCVSLTLGYSY